MLQSYRRPPASHRQPQSIASHHRSNIEERGAVVVYSSRLDKPMEAHHKHVLIRVARTIAGIRGSHFGGHYDAAFPVDRHHFYVPHDTLLLSEASCLGIRSANDLYGGVVPHLFVKTKAITHELVSRDAHRPLGWSPAFGEQVRGLVLPGYTAFTVDDARVAARRMLMRGPVRLKRPFNASGKGQTVATRLAEVETALEKVTSDELATYGIVLEENLRDVTTWSVGEVAIGDLRTSYYGKQRTVSDNEGRPVYGGSRLVCVRGGWAALDSLAMSRQLRAAVVAARRYDSAAGEYPGFIASRRNYDVGQGIAADDQPRLGVLEASWRAGGASSAELAALEAFARDPLLQLVEAAHVEEFGKGTHAPPDAIVEFEGDDPCLGPLLRYTVVKPHHCKLARRK